MRQRRSIQLTTLLLTTSALLLALPAAADGLRGGKRFFFAGLNGFEEVPAIVTGARGSFVALLDGDALHYRLRWQGLEGGDPAESVGAHIHLGQRGVNGGIMTFLCGGALPPCAGGEASGTITAEDVGVFGTAEKGVGPGEFEDFLAALRAGTAYINLHTPDFPGGELRGQVR